MNEADETAGKAQGPLGKRKKAPAIAPERVGYSDARERLLRAASDLMCDLDTINVSIRDVAERSQLNSSLIKYYFGNKDRLLLEVAEHDILPVIAEMRSVAGGPGNAEERLRALIRIMVVAIHRYPYINRLLMAMLRDFAPVHSQMIADDLAKPLNDCVMDVLNQGIATGEFRPHNPTFLWHSLAGACTQIFSVQGSLRYVNQRGPLTADERDEYGAEVTTIFLEGLRAQR